MVFYQHVGVRYRSTPPAGRYATTSDNKLAPINLFQKGRKKVIRAPNHKNMLGSMILVSLLEKTQEKVIPITNFCAQSSRIMIISFKTFLIDGIISIEQIQRS